MRFVFLFLLLPLFAQAHTFIGNGGEGVEFQGSIYVRDLFAMEIHQSPYIGAKTDSRLPIFHSIQFNYPRELLARKLTDINQMAPGLGDFLMDALNIYSWTLEEFELRPITDTNDPIVLPPGAKLVQIANRLGNTIRIHRPSWERLTEIGRAHV